MAKTGEKNNDMDVLSRIYNDSDAAPRSTGTFIKKIIQFFSDPKKSHYVLTRAILFFGIFGLIFGIAHARNLLFVPYTKKASIEESGKITLPVEGEVDQDLLGLKQKDTDQDQISDYDELYVYRTSPYLRDSDSDRYSDYDELVKGADPNCPEGKDCFAFTELESGKNVTAATETELPDTTAVAPTIQNIRALLIENGAPAEYLAAYSDAELLQMYLEEVAGYEDTTASVIAEEKVSVSNVSLDQLETMTPSQLRAFLSQQGIAQDVLDDISDQELLKTVRELLGERQ